MIVLTILFFVMCGLFLDFDETETVKEKRNPPLILTIHTLNNEFMFKHC